ncbi:MAG: hypothetical protein JNM76_14820 [Betaproteobacteria bacterium]|nr:hypothetical protein [Betaproteobacteria bacterium]
MSVLLETCLDILLEDPPYELRESIRGCVNLDNRELARRWMNSHMSNAEILALTDKAMQRLAPSMVARVGLSVLGAGNKP